MSTFSGSKVVRSDSPALNLKLALANPGSEIYLPAGDASVRIRPLPRKKSAAHGNRSSDGA